MPVGQGAVFTRAPSPNLTPTVLTPSPAVSVAGVAGLKATAHPLKSCGVPTGTKMKSHGKVPLPSTSVADCVMPLEVPGAPPMSGSVASRLSVTFRLLVATAPSLIWTVPLGGVASMRVVPVASKVLKSPTMQLATVWQAATLIEYCAPSRRRGERGTRRWGRPRRSAGCPRGVG